MYLTHSQFKVLMADEFGDSYAETLKKDFVLTECGYLTVHDALASGYAPSEVWEALCDALDVPEGRRLGKLPKEFKPISGSFPDERATSGSSSSVLGMLGLGAFETDTPKNH